MKKTVLSVLLLLLMLIIFGGSSNSIQAATENKTITPTNNHVLADVDEIIDTSLLNVDGAFGEITLSQATLSSDDPAVTITANSVTISEKGVFPIQMTYDTDNLTIYFITKLSSETEYVIYQEDFTGLPNGALPSSLTMRNNIGQAGGSAAINNERLMLSPLTQVLFPSYLAAFSNYIIETDMRMTAATNASRWTSVMFRYTTENYYQMAIRQDATAANGVEFAKRIDGNWNVPATTSFTEALDPATTYQLKVDVFETSVKEYINDVELISYEGMFEYTNGRIGVQADNVTVYYDNIVIRLPEEYVTEERYNFTQIAEVYQPTTNIVAPATSVVWFNELSQLDDLSETERPATMIFRVNSNLDIFDIHGDVVATALDVLIEADGKVIPAFYTKSVTAAEAVAEFLKDNRIIDVFIVSESSDVILAAREIHSVIRGVKWYPMDDVESLTKADLMDVRRETNSAQAVASVLPAHLLTKELVQYMQQRLMTVWVSANSDEISLYQAILTGANGIVAQDYKTLFDIYEIFPVTTHVRKPLIIAHRGLYAGGAVSPENTIESAMIAVEKGADILELDVHLTLDFEVIVMHDNNTARTAPDFDSITLASAFYPDLQDMYLRDPQSDRTDIKIPTLGEYLEAFKGEDVVIFIELKPTNELLVQFTQEVIEEHEMYDQAVIISFAQQNISWFNEYYPDITNGWLNSSVLNISSVTTSLSNMISSIVPINATLNPNFGPLTEPFIDAIVHRGITVWPWTLNEYAMLTTYYNYGVGGITTDHTGYLENTFDRLILESNRFEYIIGESEAFEINAFIETPNGTSYPIMPEYVVFDEDETGMTLDASGNLLSVTNPGKAYAYTMFTSNLPDGKTINLVSELITFEFSLPTPDEEPVDEPDETPGMSLGVTITIITGSTAILSGGIFLGLRYFKLRKLVK